MANGYFPGKKPAKRSAIITPRTAQEMQIAAMPRMVPEVRKTLRDATPLRGLLVFSAISDGTKS